MKAIHTEKREEMGEGDGKKKKKKSETFPLHLALSMIFSANSFPVDLGRNSAIRANHKNGTDAATTSVIQIKGSQESRSYSAQEPQSYWKGMLAVLAKFIQ